MAHKRTRRPGSPRRKAPSSGDRKNKLDRSVARRAASKQFKLQDFSPLQLQDYENSLAAISAVRRGYAFGFDDQGQFSRVPVRGIRHAARIIGIPFRKLERYIGSVLFRDRKGRIQVTQAD